MNHQQSRWLYDIFQKHGFNECVEAFEQNIEILGYDKELNRLKQECLQKLEAVTIGRREYIQTEISKYEKCLKDSVNLAYDIRFCDVYNVGKIIWNYVLSKTIIDELGKRVEEKKTKTIPKELRTDIAKKWLEKAIKSGFLNSDYSTTDKLKTKAKKALFAECFSEKIGLRNKYIYFENLWGVSGLSKTRYKSREEIGKVKGGKPIEEFFQQDKI